MSEATDSAVEAKEKSQAVALIIAILALLLALAEAGAKNAQHLSTEKNMDRQTSSISTRPSAFARPSWRRQPRCSKRKNCGDRPEGARGVRKADRRFQSDRGAIRKGPQESRRQSWKRSRIEPRKPPKNANWPTAGSDITSSEAAWPRSRSCSRRLRSSPGLRPLSGSAPRSGRSARRSSPSGFSPRPS